MDLAVAVDTAVKSIVEVHRADGCCCMLAAEFGNTAVPAADKIEPEGTAQHGDTAGLGNIGFAADMAGVANIVGLAVDTEVAPLADIAHLE